MTCYLVYGIMFEGELEAKMGWSIVETETPNVYTLYRNDVATEISVLSGENTVAIGYIVMKMHHGLVFDYPELKTWYREGKKEDAPFYRDIVNDFKEDYNIRQKLKTYSFIC